MPTSLTIELLAARAHSHTRLRQLLADRAAILDRKSTRLNSSHGYISYAVFCLKKKNIHDFHALLDRRIDELSAYLQHTFNNSQPFRSVPQLYTVLRIVNHVLLRRTTFQPTHSN